jgi:hypothetical protein
MAAMSPERRILLGLAHKAAVLAGLSDDARRAVQQAVVGKASCAEMTDTELRRLLWHYKAKGVDIGVPGPKPRGGGGWASPTPQQWAEIERLAGVFGWVDGLEDRRLESFVGRTAGVDAVRFLSRDGASRVISGLKRWQKSLARRSGAES